MTLQTQILNRDIINGVLSVQANGLARVLLTTPFDDISSV
jgi:hypothetical protein